MIGIYKITSPSGKVYIGQTTDLDKRWSDYEKLKCKAQTKLYRSFLKYGVINHVFEYIEECGESDLNLRERHWQDCYNVLKCGLNCRLTTTNDKSGKSSEETKRKIGLKSKGRIWREESRKRLSTTNTGRIMPKESVKKTSDSHKLNGHKPNQEALDNATKVRREKGIRIKELTTNTELYLWEAEEYFGIPKGVIAKNSLKETPLERKKFKGLNFIRI